ncbi:conserved hypothetical protein [Ricinus communis]|uniref:S-protein homolog n=1 Tax=Ricinus communis TaxID=3988 RepID=B9RWP1_RICCO|nr:conserved hypothetical protein [Ricinus communis]
MSRLSIRCWLQLAVLFMLLMTTVSDASFIVPKKKTVKITNDLGPKLGLKLHCKSKNDDLGEQQVPYKGSFSFRFRPNPWGTTRFYCQMKWQNIIRWFDIYVDDRDFERCVVCEWRIQASGPCLLNSDTGKFDICFPWNP